MRRTTSAMLLFCALLIFARGETRDPCAPPNFPLPQFKSATFRREAASASAGFFIAHATGVRLQDVELSYEAAERRPSLVAHDVSALELDALRMQKFNRIQLMRLNKIDELTVHQSPGLSERNGERVDVAEE